MSVLLKKFKIEGLFYQYDYEFTFDEKSWASILTMPNGYGKSTVLKLIKFMLNPNRDDIDIFSYIVFKSAKLWILEDGYIEMYNDDFNDTYYHDVRRFNGPKESGIFEKEKVLNFGSIDFDSDDRKSYNLELTDIDLNIEDEYEYSYYGLDDATLRNYSMSQYPIRKNKFKDDSAQCIIREIKHYTYKINCQNIVKVVKFDEFEKKYEDELFLIANEMGHIHCGEVDGNANYYAAQMEYFDIMEKSDERFNYLEMKEEKIINKIIDDILKKSYCFGNLSCIINPGTLDRLSIEKKMKKIMKVMSDVSNQCWKEYKTNLGLALEKTVKAIADSNNNILTFDEFYEKLFLYFDEADKYRKLGFMIYDTPLNFEKMTKEEVEGVYKNNSNMLSIFAEEIEKTLQPFKKVYERLSMFVEIFNSYNEGTHKKMIIDSSGMHVFLGLNEIYLSKLSSGEKQIIILFYELIFGDNTGKLVMIDEPETSTHISWQSEFMDRLLEICRLQKMQALVVTHSPYIIGDYGKLLLKKEMKDVYYE